MIREGRLTELDVLRGFAVAIMILVVSPGSWAHTYGWLQHADWQGWTFADLVFPDFLFGVGMALALTRGRSGDRGPWMGRLARRVAGLVLLGLALNFLPVIAGWMGAASVGPTDTVTWRLPGVLQRIALCYALAFLIVYPFTRARADAGQETPMRAGGAAILGIVVLLLGYWALVALVPAPGFAAGNLSKAGNLAGAIDRAIFTPDHMWPLGAESWRGPVVYDPEGLLTTVPATANVLFGFLAMTIWQGLPRRRHVALLAGGIALVLAGLALDGAFPINKKLWTSSFALLTSGISVLAFLAAVAVLRLGATRRTAAPLAVLGRNALLAFVLSALFSAFGSIPFVDGQTPQAIGFAAVNRVIADPYVASIACAMGILAAIAMLLWPLDRRGIYLRV